MSNHLILTVAGPDRPGLVESVAAAVATHGGNWLESRLIHLGGYFAGVVRVDVPAASHGALRTELTALSARGLTVNLMPAANVVEPGREFTVSVTGLDRPGIVSQISAVVSRAGLNVEEFTSAVVSAPMSGESLFTATARLSGPVDADLDILRSSLEKLSAELMVEAVLSES
jgi:glycine cleavage system regulatory protein